MQTLTEKDHLDDAEKTFLTDVFFRLFYCSLFVVVVALIYVASASADLKKQHIAANTELRKVEDLVARVDGDSAKLNEVKNQVFNGMLAHSTSQDQQ